MPAAPARPGYDEAWREVYGDMQDHGPVHRHMRRLLRRVLKQAEYESALEVGCGAGHNLALLTEGRALARVTGLDVSAEALERARAAGFDDARQMDIEREAPEGEWELVFSSLVLEHLPDDERALANMRAACGRQLLVTTIAGDFDRYRAWDERMGHVRNYRRGELEAKLERAGFEVERALYWGFPFYSPLARMLQNRMNPKPAYGAATRALAAAMYALYWLNLPGRGDLLIVSARPR